MDPVVSPGQVSVQTTQPSHGGYSEGYPGVPMSGGYPMGQTTNQTTVVVQQPSIMKQVGPRLWSTNLCSCCEDMGSCLLGTFCPIVLACNVASRMGESFCVPCCVPGAIVVMRTKLRTENNIQGSIMDDGCVVCCCGPCVICQLSREIDFVQRMQE